jgi:hypothetical protein
MVILSVALFVANFAQVAPQITLGSLPGGGLYSWVKKIL